MYIGRGIVLGLDTGEGLARGTYREEGGRLKGSMTLTVRDDNVSPNGKVLKAGESTEIEIDLPPDFADGRTLQETIMGDTFDVVYTKLGDIP